MYVLTIKQSISVLSICAILYLLAPTQSIPVSIETVQAKEVKTTTGVVASGVVAPIQIAGKKNPDKKLDIGRGISNKKVLNDDSEVLISKIECDTTCKVETLVSLGIAPKIASSLVNACKENADNPVRCIKLGASIVAAESGGGDRCYKNGCFGILAGGISYESIEKSTEDWVKRYNRSWYRQTNPSSFYNNVIGGEPRTHYCMSESDTNIHGYCPKGHKNSWDMWNKLSKVF